MYNMCVYTVWEVAEILKVSTKTVYHLIRDNELFAIRVRGQIRITSYALDDYIARGGSSIEAKYPRELVP